MPDLIKEKTKYEAFGGSIKHPEQFLLDLRTSDEKEDDKANRPRRTFNLNLSVYEKKAALVSHE